MEFLPTDILLEIFLFLHTDADALLACDKTCKRWKSILYRNDVDETLWKPMVYISYEKTMEIKDMMLASKSWKMAYLTAKNTSSCMKILFFGDFINANACHLAVIPSFIVFSTLQVLTLKYNALVTIPPQLSTLTDLRVLNLSYNGIESLPYQLSTLTNLEHLSFDYNRVESIPKEYGTLAKLTRMTAYANKLTYIEEPIVRWTNLLKLNLGNNSITLIHSSFFKLTNLTTLNLMENPMMVWPQELTRCTKLMFT